MSSLAPRIVLVTRQTELEHLLAEHATRGQVEFFLKTREQSIDQLQIRHDLQFLAVQKTRQFIPDDWSIAKVDRRNLDRFMFGKNDIIIAIGQDGLVANLAKYLTGQPVIGITPDPEKSEGVLTPLSVDVLPIVLLALRHGKVGFQKRTMVKAHLDDGQTLLALNEVFLGHKSHQSAKYIISINQKKEYQSSSGIIVSTGTGLTGWAKSILTATHREAVVKPHDRKAVFFAREPWPSRVSGTNLSYGAIKEKTNLSVISRMNNGGVIFADGIEQDFLHFNWGSRVEIGLAENTLNLVV
ncbi:MAG: hypothetical protein V3U57_06120 [Robiginitomaculum sp.]